MTLRQDAASTPGSREKGERMWGRGGGRCITLQGSSQSLYQAGAELQGKDRPSEGSYTWQDPTSSRTPSCSTLGAEWEGHGLSANPKVQQLTTLHQPPPTAGSLEGGLNGATPWPLQLPPILLPPPNPRSTCCRSIADLYQSLPALLPRYLHLLTI